MTVPFGVPNLPAGALTLETLAARLQDQSAAQMRNLAGERMPSIFNVSTGGIILSDLTPFGIITRIWAAFMSFIANADPNDVDGPEDLPGLLTDFIESLPVIGELVELLEAILGTYTGTDPVLLAVQEIFAPIRKLLQLVSGQDVGFPTVEEVAAGWVDLGAAITVTSENWANFLAATGQADIAALGGELRTLIGWLSGIPANQVSGVLSGANIPGLDASKVATGTLDLARLPASVLTTASTIAAAAISGLLDASNIPSLDGSKIGSGTVDLARLPSSLLTTASSIAAAALTGTIDVARLPASVLTTASSVAASAITGVLAGSNIPALDGSKIGTGTVDLARLPASVLTTASSIAAAVVTGVLAAANIPGLDGTKITTGTIDLARLPASILTTASSIVASAVSGVLAAANIPGMDASKITTGVFAQAFVTGLPGMTSDINAMISNAGQSTAAAVGTAVSGAAANAQGLVSGVNNAAAGVASGAASDVATAEANIATLFGGAPQYLQGLSGIFGQSATNSAYSASAAAQAAAAAQLAQQQSAFNAVFNVSPATTGNVNVTVDFTSVANQNNMGSPVALMTPGTGSGAGYMGVTSGEMALQGGVSGSDTELFPTQTVSDYQVADYTLGNLKDLLYGGQTLFLIFRSNSSRNTYGYFAIQYGSPSVQGTLGCVVSGVNHTFANTAVGALSSIATGGKFRIIAGDPGSASPYALQILYNGTPVLTYSDTSHTSQIGAGQRYLGARMDNSSSKYPPQVKTVTYQDNPPAPASYPFSGRPTAGTKGRRYASGDCGREDRDNGSAWENVWGGVLNVLTSPGASSGFSTSTLGTATFAADRDALLITAPSVAGANLRAAYKSLAATSNYKAQLEIEVAGGIAANSTYWGGGVILRDSASGKLIKFGAAYYNASGYYAAMEVVQYTSPTAVAAVAYRLPVYEIPGCPWPVLWQIRDDGTNRYYEYSLNGVDYMTFYSEARTTFVTPNQIGFGIDNQGSGVSASVRMRSLTGV